MEQTDEENKVCIHLCTCTYVCEYYIMCSAIIT